MPLDWSLVYFIPEGSHYKGLVWYLDYWNSQFCKIFFIWKILYWRKLRTRIFGWGWGVYYLVYANNYTFTPKVTLPSLGLGDSWHKGKANCSILHFKFILRSSINKRERIQCPFFLYFCTLTLDRYFFCSQVAGCNIDTTLDHSVSLSHLSSPPTAIS